MRAIGRSAQAVAACAIDLALSHRRAIRLVLMAAMAAVLATTGWRLIRGQYGQDENRILMAFYLAPMYLLTLGWAAVMLQRPRLLQPTAVWVDVLAVGVAASRTLTSVIPASGHVVFLLYTILVTRHRTYRVLAGVYLAATLTAKFALWHDFITPVVGSLIAWALWRLRSRAMRELPRQL